MSEGRPLLRNSTAWEHIVIHPDAAAVAKLQNGYNSMQTRFGPTVVYWRLMPAVNGSHAFLETNATIPVGSTAEIVSARIVAEVYFSSHRWCCGQVHDSRLELLGCELSAVEESGQLLWAAEAEAEEATLPAGLASVAPADEGTGTVSRFGSGVYTFRARYSC